MELTGKKFELSDIAPGFKFVTADDTIHEVKRMNLGGKVFTRALGDRRQHELDVDTIIRKLNSGEFTKRN